MLVEHILRSFIGVAAIAAAAGPNAPASDWATLVERLGLAVALVIFFVTTGWIREKRMAKRLDHLEDAKLQLEIANATLTEKLAALTDKVTTALSRENTLVDDALKVLDGRTCFAFKSRDEFDAFKDALREWRKERKLVTGTVHE
jgi:hypothetical protein